MALNGPHFLRVNATSPTLNLAIKGKIIVMRNLTLISVDKGL